MIVVLSTHFISTKSSCSTSLLFLILLTGPSNTLALGPGKVRAGLNEHGRVEGRVRSRGDRGRGRSSIDAITDTGYGDNGVSGVGTVPGNDSVLQGDPGPTRLRSVFSIDKSGLWEPRSSSRCVPIPSRMALCQNIAYDTMRLPNLLGHESQAEAVQQSTSWLPLLSRECHPDARMFLCSLFAPICLERFISPCKSLCESVRDSCAPIMRCYGYPWPEILRCDHYPADHLMCISSITNSTAHTEGHRVPQASCQDCELEVSSSSKDTLENFCRSDFVLKLHLTRLKYSPVSLAQFLAAKLEVLKHGPLLGGQIHSRIEQWLEWDVSCVKNMTRQQPRGGSFLVTGTVQGERLVVNKAYTWHKRDKNLVAAMRKWKGHQCRN